MGLVLRADMREGESVLGRARLPPSREVGTRIDSAARREPRPPLVASFISRGDKSATTLPERGVHSHDIARKHDREMTIDL